jgi:hypothetical protein
MKFVLTETHLERARTMGRNHALVEQELGRAEAHPNPLDEEDIRTIAWDITTVKLDPESDEAIEIANAYEDAYFEEWEN